MSWLHPPRAEGSTRASGERCSTDAQCPNGYGCIEPAGASGYGMCLEYCGSNSDCDAGFVCVSESVGTSADLVTFCRPGLAEQTATTELCTPCTGGADCSSGFCLSDGTNQFCSQGCLGPEDCPTGFECIASSVGSGCWPLDPDNCGEDTRGILGDICFVESGRVMAAITTTGVAQDSVASFSSRSVVGAPGLVCCTAMKARIVPMIICSAALGWMMPAIA